MSEAMAMRLQAVVVCNIVAVPQGLLMLAASGMNDSVYSTSGGNY